MSFLLYLILIALTYIRVFEAFAPELLRYRPMLVLSIVALVAAFIRLAVNREVAAAPRHFFILIGLIFSIALSISANGWLGGGAAAVLDFAPTAALFLLTLLNLTSISRLRTTCAVIVISMLVDVAGSVAGYHFGFLGHRLLVFQSTIRGDDEDMVTEDEQEAGTEEPGSDDTIEDPLIRIRGLGMLSDPNDLAQAIVMVLPLVCLAWTSGSRLRNLVVAILPASFFLYAIYLTHSRGALIGLIAVIFVGLRKSLGAIRTLALVGLLVAFAIVTNLAGGRAYSVTESSAGDRLELWGIGLSMFRTHPWFGIGYGKFIENSGEYGLTAHNSFVLCLAELGLMGTFFWLALIVTAGRDLFLTESSSVVEGSEEMQRLLTVLEASLFGFLACALFLSRTYSPHLFLLLGLCISACYCAWENEESPRSLAWIPQSAAALAVGILVVYAVIRFKHALGT